MQNTLTIFYATSYKVPGFGIGKKGKLQHKFSLFWDLQSSSACGSELKEGGLSSEGGAHTLQFTVEVT